MSESNDKVSFHSQEIVLRLAMGANIVSWLVLAFYVVNFASDIRTLVQNWPLQLPNDFFAQLSTWVGFISTPVFGVFYFLMLQGISQLLYIGLDLYLELAGDEEDAE